MCTERIRGAIYIPARAFNAPQMWRDYRPEEARRDMCYAKLVNLNALRVWVSYEYWRMQPDRFKEAFDDFLDAGREAGIRIMPSLFEDCGVPPTEENMWARDPLKAFAITSPDKNEIVADPERWEEPGEFVDWIMAHYKNDDRLLAIEVMNEPRMPKISMKFARYLFKRASEQRGTVPLTLGCCNLIDNICFMEYEIDVLQFHQNFPRSEQQARRVLREGEAVSNNLDRPVWITEVQRIRRSSDGFDSETVTERELGPDLNSYLPIIHKHSLGFFFWSLMVKPAYLPNQREKGTINGLFWEDGAVWSLEDARAVADNPELELPERQGWPHWGPQAG